MTASYRGIYQLASADKPPHDQVASPGGHSIPFPIDQHESRGVMPKWRKLPKEKQYKALAADAEKNIHRGCFRTYGENSWR